MNKKYNPRNIALQTSREFHVQTLVWLVSLELEKENRQCSFYRSMAMARAATPLRRPAPAKLDEAAPVKGTAVVVGLADGLDGFAEAVVLTRTGGTGTLLDEEHRTVV